MCRSIADIQSPTAEISRGKKERKKKKERRRKKEETTGSKNIMVCPIPYGDHNELQVINTEVIKQQLAKQ